MYSLRIWDTNLSRKLLKINYFDRLGVVSCNSSWEIYIITNKISHGSRNIYICCVDYITVSVCLVCGALYWDKFLIELVLMQVASSLTSSAGNTDEIYFDFRKQCFIFSVEKNTFCKLPYPTKESFGYYLKCTGHGSEPKVVTATNKWGRNV